MTGQVSFRRFHAPAGSVFVGHATIQAPVIPGGLTPAYPVLTEEVGYPPSPLALDGTSARNGGGSGSFGPTVTKALQDVLGWKIKANDAKGFVGALTQSFDLKTEEGAVVSTWTPRSYAVQTDLSGGITGAQASIYTMASTMLGQMLPLIDGLNPLDPACDRADAAAAKSLVRTQLTDLTAEIGNLGGPRVMRVHQYFQMLLGVQIELVRPARPPWINITSGVFDNRSPLAKIYSTENPPPAPKKRWPPPNAWANPDTVLGSLGELRDLLGLSQDRHLTFINTVDDEQNVTNMRIVVDYAASLLAAWQSNVQFFAGSGAPFLGTQLVLISRQLGVVSEVVDEVRFVLDSVFIGPSQRESLLLNFPSLGKIKDVVNANDITLPMIYLEDLLTWIQNFVAVEAPQVIQDGGRLGVGSDFEKMVHELTNQAYGLVLVAQNDGGALGSGRVWTSLVKLLQRLYELHQTARRVSRSYIGPRP